jgi:iron complex transport system permease protein
MKVSVKFLLLTVLVLFLAVLDVACGTVSLSLREVWAALTGGPCEASVSHIVWHIRVLKAAVALLAGMALSVSGLQMQTLFRNPLAGPYVLGISAGAGLGVALLLLAGLSTPFGIAAAAWLGAAAVFALIVAVGARIKDLMVILILGIMLSSGIGAVVQILQYLSHEEALKSYVLWTMGSLGEVTSPQLAVLAAAVMVGLVLAVAGIKPLNMLLLGEQYARTMGLNMRRSRLLILISTTLLAGSVTAFCGPISFIGLAMPHVARAVCRTADHRILLPASALIGAATLTACDLLSKLLVLPINSITALVGIPIVIWVVIRNQSFSA